MIDKALIDKFLDESPSLMDDCSRSAVRAFFIRFFDKSQKRQLSEFSRQDFIDIFSQMQITEESTFESDKSRIKKFIRWFNDNEYSIVEQVNGISSISFSEIDSIESDFATHYYSDFYDLYETMSYAFHDKGSEYDTFKSIAILLWHGFELNVIPDILKADVIEQENCVLHPIKKTKFIMSELAIDFLAKYRDALEFDSSKFGGSIQKYSNGFYLIRTSKNPHITVKQLRNIAVTANAGSTLIEKKFKWRAIYQSGVYYRLYQYEKANGDIGEKNYDILKLFFQESDTVLRNRILSKKYNKYCKFKEAKLLQI